MSIFAERLKELRTEKNLSQKELADELKISQAIISHYEKDIRKPTLDIIVMLCKYFKVSADYLIGLED